MSIAEIIILLILGASALVGSIDVWLYFTDRETITRAVKKAPGTLITGFSLTFLLGLLVGHLWL